MDLEWAPHHREFRQQLREFLQANEGKVAEGGGSRPDASRIAWQKKLIEHGYAARTVPVEYGGYGAEPDVLISRVIAEEFAASDLPGSLSGQGISMLVPTLLEVGSEEQKRRWVPPTLTGEVIWCQGYSEPGSGSDLASLRTRAEVDGDDFVINGQKIWTSTAHAADMMFCLVRTEPEAPKHLGISYVLIPMDTPGIDVRPLKSMTGHAEFNEVFFTDVRVPVANTVGQRGEGWRVANATLKHERGMLGDPDATLRRFEALVRLLREEREDGRALLDNATLRDRLARLQGQLLGMRYNGMRLLSSDGMDTTMARLVVKLNGCELNHQINALAIDALEELGALYGGGEHLRDDGQWQWDYMFQLGLIIGGGTAQIQKNIISERGLGMPREPKAAPAAAAKGGGGGRA